MRTFLGILVCTLVMVAVLFSFELTRENMRRNLNLLGTLKHIVQQQWTGMLKDAGVDTPEEERLLNEYDSVPHGSVKTLADLMQVAQGRSVSLDDCYAIRDITYGLWQKCGDTMTKYEII